MALELTLLDLALESQHALPLAVRICCDLPGQDAAGRAHAANMDDSGVLELNERFLLPLEPHDGPAARALAAALRSADDEASDLFFVVNGRYPGAAAEAEIGVAHINLKACAAADADETDETRDLYNSTGEVVGAMSLTVRLAGALRRLMSAWRLPLPPPALESPDTLTELTFAIGGVQLTASPPSSGDVFIALELAACPLPPELAEGPAETPSAALAGTSAYIRSRISLPLSGARVRSALKAAMLAESAAELSDVHVLLLLEGDSEPTPASVALGDGRVGAQAVVGGLGLLGGGSAVCTETDT